MLPVRSKPFAIGLALAVAAAGGYWAYTLYTQAELRKTATALVTDTGGRLRNALDGAAAGAPAAAPDRIKEIEAHAAAVERNYSELRRLEADAVGALAALADDYILTSREILRRIAITHRTRLSLAASSAALRDHMRSDRGQATWPGTAVRLKESVDQDYRDYRLAADALLPLLESFPMSQARIAPHLDPAALVEPDAVTSARSALAETIARLATEVGKLTNLDAYR